MNDHEIIESQVEKELLTIYFDIQKCHDFIYHLKVDVKTDHKPIMSIMNKNHKQIWFSLFAET